jgi:hypothetical protein
MKKNTLLLVLISFGSFLYAQLPCDSLVCYFPFNGNAEDLLSLAIIDTVHGAELSTDRFGNDSSAYIFDGIDDYIEISNFAMINPSNQISFSIWAQALGNSSNCMLMLYPDNNNDRCVTCAQYQGNIFWDYGNILDGDRMSVSGIEYDTLWHHYVFQYDSVSRKKEIYMDGILLRSEETHAELSDYDRKLWIGGGIDGSSGDIHFLGRIDDIRIYNKLLKTHDVMQLYSEGKCYAVIYDTIKIFDTIPVYDTIPVIDSITVFDTVRTVIYDSISVVDTLIIDAVFVGLDSEPFMNTITVYPNPARRKIFIDTGQEFEKMSGHTIRFLNSSGSIVFVSAIDKSLMEIPVDELGSPGLYILQIVDSGGGLVNSNKILLE